MLSRHIVVWTFAVANMFLALGVVSGQEYPNKPIRIVTGSGGTGEFASRIIAQGLTGRFGQPVIVDSRGGTIPIEVVAKAPADGYTLLFYSNSLWLYSFMQTVSYDPVKDFSLITLTNRQPSVLVVHPSSPVRSVKDLIVWAKAKPGELNYSSGLPGSNTQLAPELFKAMTGVNIVGIFYKTTGQSFSAVIGGEVQLMFGTAASVTPFVDSGKLKALAITSAQPSGLFPGLPTVAATVPGYEFEGIFGVFGPAKMPATIVNRLNQEIVRFLNTTETKERFLNTGVEVVGSSPEQFAAARNSDMVKMGKVIKDARIKAD